MANEKSPAFQFYPKDWLTDINVMTMTPAQRGGYFQLLCYMWLDDACSLPNDDNVLAKLTDCVCEDIAVIKKCFEERDGRLYQKRLLEERKKQYTWKKKASEAGKKASKTRWQKGKGGDADRIRNVSTSHTKPMRKGNSSSSFSSSPTEERSTTVSTSPKLSDQQQQKEPRKPNSNAPPNSFGGFSNLMKLTDPEDTKFAHMLHRHWKEQDGYQFGLKRIDNLLGRGLSMRQIKSAQRIADTTQGKKNSIIFTEECNRMLAEKQEKVPQQLQKGTSPCSA